MSAHCKRFHQSVCYIYLDYHDIAEKCLTVDNHDIAEKCLTVDNQDIAEKCLTMDNHDIAEKCLTVLINTNTPLFIGGQLLTKFLKTGFHFENKYITELLLAVVM